MHKTELTDESIMLYKNAGAILKKVKAGAIKKIEEGSRLLDLAVSVESEIRKGGAIPAFPCNISINDVASHYTPSADDDRRFKACDLVKVDIGVCLDGYIADSAFTVEVGSNAHSGLIKAAENALQNAINEIRPGSRTCDIGRIIHDTAKDEGFSVLKDLFGHNLNRYSLHGGITIPNYDDHMGVKIREGDVLAIEPFLTAGSGAIKKVGMGNIYQLLRKNPVYACGDSEKELLKEICSSFGGLPFAGRWVDDEKALKSLASSAAIKSYPMLITVDGMPVAQAEHTVMVDINGCTVIT
jgi:methionyl aminopeptidase